MTSQEDPFVMLRGTEFIGFSIDILQALKADGKLKDFDYVLYEVDDYGKGMDDIITELTNGVTRLLGYISGMSDFSSK